MPRLIDYPAVVQQMSAAGFVSLYFNSGAFGFSPEVATQSTGWIGQADRTIRPEALALTRQVPEPIDSNLAALAVRAWKELLGGTIWVTPKSHWAYELDFGSHTWMPAALESAGVSREQLHALCTRHDGSALEFELAESDRFRVFLETLLKNLFGSDFQLACPGKSVVCSVHHHKQLWWTSTDAVLMASLEQLL